MSRDDDSDFGASSELSGGEAEAPLPDPLAVAVEAVAETLLDSPPGLLLPDWAACGGELLVGVVISIGSPGDGADIWMVGVMMGIVREVIGSSGPSTMRGMRTD